jgi:hypothetical protein
MVEILTEAPLQATRNFLTDLGLNGSEGKVIPSIRISYVTLVIELRRAARVLGSMHPPLVSFFHQRSL